MKPLYQFALGFGIASVLAAAAHGDGFTATGGMAYPRYNHTATRLLDGRVLVAAGCDGDSGPLASAELYNPATGTWTATGSLNQAREGHTTTLLPNGKVLVTAGIYFGGCTIHLGSSETYNPTNGTWSYSGGTSYRYGHTATLLPNGKVLFVGGKGDVGRGILSSAELYNPATDSSSSTGSLGIPRYFHTATLLPNGKVLVVGGNNGPGTSAELYDPVTGTWSPAGNPTTPGSAALLPNGKVLVVGDGIAELYSPTTGTWSPAGNPSTSGTATLLPNGKVLVVGVASAELYDPGAGTWSSAGSPVFSLFSYTATLLSNGQVLLAAGGAELYASSLNPILNPLRLGDGSFQFSFSNPTGLSYHILAGPSATAPLNTWSNLGPATEKSPGSGQFQYTDHQATNYSQRFYRVSLP
jgi:hypothetical protein